MSRKSAQNMSSNAEVTYSEGKVHPSDDGSQPRCELYLDELTLGATGVITVMICRSWDVHTLTGRYVSTDFVMSDAKGNAIHSYAKANVAHNFLKLKEGLVYCLKNFVVQSNKEEYRIFRDHTYMIELDGATSVRKASIKSGGFVRYPFQLIPLGSIELTDNKYLIDVAGYVTNVGRISHQKSGSRTLDFSLANGSEDKSSTFKCKVKIDDIRSQKGWNFPACGGEKCKKGVVRKNGSFWCQACEKAVDYPVLRFRLELDVSDKTASTVVVMFDEPTKELLKCSTDSLAAADDESGFGYVDHAGLPLVLANIIGTTHTLEMKSHTYYEHGTLWMIVTLCKPSELQATKAAGLTSEINRQAVMD
ncbi:RNA-directed DNA polymerase, eukaryota [Tanacetum coccineum]